MRESLMYLRSVRNVPSIRS